MVNRRAVKQFLRTGLCDGLGCGDINAYVRQCAAAAERGRRVERHLATAVTSRPLTDSERRDLQAACERVLVR